MKAALYTRVSTQSQNVKRQLTELEAKCLLKKWLVVVKISDVITGAAPYSSREGFTKIFELVDKKKVDLVMVHEISRLGRNTVDVLKCIQELNARNVAVYIMNVDVVVKPDRVDPSANLIVAILASLATHERELMRQRIMSGLKSSTKKSGRKVGDRYDKSRYEQKYPVVVKLLEDNYSLKTISNLTGVSYRTVQRINAVVLK